MILVTEPLPRLPVTTAYSREAAGSFARISSRRVSEISRVFSSRPRGAASKRRRVRKI